MYIKLLLCFILFPWFYTYTEFQGSVQECLDELTQSEQVDLHRAKINFAIAAVKAYVARQVAVQQRNLEYRVMIEKRKSKYIHLPTLETISTDKLCFTSSYMYKV